MRFFLLLLCLLAAAVSAPADPIKIVTWNIEWLPGRHPDATPEEKAAQMKAAQEVLKQLNPDVLLCQEVFDYATAVELCSVIPGLQVDVVSSYGPRPQNEVIASKLPLDSAWYDSWKPTLGDGNPPRGYAFAALKLPNGAFLLTFNTHLKSNLGGIAATIPVREESAKQLRVLVKDMEALYGQRGPCDVVLGGDCNSSKDSAEFKEDHTLAILAGDDLHWVFDGTAPDSHVTIPAKGKYPADTFDHLFYEGLKEDSVTVPDNGGASDHNPVVVLFEPQS